MIQLSLGMDDPFSELPKVVNLKKEEYALVKLKDPNTIYVITNSDKNEIYKGDLLISSDQPKRQYFIGNGEKVGEYILYLNNVTSNYDRLIPICRYDDPQIAIKELHELNCMGSHTKLEYQLYLLLIQFIKKEMTIHELIMAIFTEFGYAKDTEFQDLIQRIEYFHITTLIENPESTAIAMNGLRRLPNKLCIYYANLYDLLWNKLRCFSKRKYKKPPEELVLDDEIKLIIITMEQGIEKK